MGLSLAELTTARNSESPRELFTLGLVLNGSTALARVTRSVACATSYCPAPLASMYAFCFAQASSELTIEGDGANSEAYKATQARREEYVFSSARGRRAAARRGSLCHKTIASCVHVVRDRGVRKTNHSRFGTVSLLFQHNQNTTHHPDPPHGHCATLVTRPRDARRASRRVAPSPAVRPPSVRRAYSHATFRIAITRRVAMRFS